MLNLTASFCYEIGIILPSWGFKTKYVDDALKMLQSVGIFKPRKYWASDQEGNERERLEDYLY